MDVVEVTVGEEHGADAALLFDGEGGVDGPGVDADDVVDEEGDRRGGGRRGVVRAEDTDPHDAALCSSCSAGARAPKVLRNR